MSGFELIPSIDLLGGQGVRLSEGRYDHATVYEADPVAAARRFAAHPIARFHVVDLDGARSGERRNAEIVRGIVQAMGSIPVQLGGGVRDREAIEWALGCGVDRVILGTVALRDPGFVRDVAKAYPERIVVGIDARDGHVAVEGWLETSDARSEDLARQFEDAGVAAIVHTDISRDGRMQGPDFEGTAQLAESVDIPVILSGGVSSEDDLVHAAGLVARGVAGAIVGRALYNGAVEVGSALRRLAECS